jgi:predicted esterase
MTLTPKRAATACAAAISLALAALASSAHGASSADSALPSDPGVALRSRIDAARGHLLSHYREVDARSGLADVIETRLDADESSLFIASKPDNASASDFWDWNATIVALDSSLVDQLTTGTYHPLGAVRGIDDIPIPTHASGPPAPCAIDVPSTYSPDKAATLVVLLHGKGVSEATELAEPVFRGLASETGAIVIAPFGRGDDLRSPAAAQDIYAAVDAVQAALNIDKRRVYLVGDSLGGYAAFDVATVRAGTWNSVLAIRSTMDPSDQDLVKDQLHAKAVYIVAGTADQIVNVDDVRRSVSWFRSVGMATSYYEAPGAAHDIVALTPFVQRAWREMLAGVRSLQPPQIDVPSMTPPPSQKP